MNRLEFEKTGTAVFISHLDLIRIFQRSFRRGGMLLKHSQGFTPHAYISIMLPLSVGVSSECEILDFEMDEADHTDLELVPALLNKTMPDGIRVKRFYQSDRKARDLSLLHAKVTMEYDRGVTPEIVCAVQEVLARPEILVEKKTKSKELVQQNIKEMICRCDISATEDAIVLDCVVCAQNPSLNPLQLAKAIAIYAPQAACDFASCHRLQFLDAEGKPFA